MCLLTKGGESCTFLERRMDVNAGSARLRLRQQPPNRPCSRSAGPQSRAAKPARASARTLDGEPVRRL